jgi:hypothetical protein
VSPAGPAPPAWRRRGLFLFVLAAVTIIVWNGTFDGRMKQGIWDYVDRQQRYVAGEGSWTDVDAAMRASVSRGLRDATLAALGAAALVYAVGRKSRQPDGR